MSFNGIFVWDAKNGMPISVFEIEMNFPFS